MYEITDAALSEATGALTEVDEQQIARLHARARLLAHLSTQDETAERLSGAAEQYSERLTDLVKGIANDYAEACKKIPGATEDEVWDQVFRIELGQLNSAPDNDMATTIAAKLLTANLLATLNDDPTEATIKLQERMWTVAHFHFGRAVVEAGQKYQKVFVRTQPGHYTSLQQQVYPLTDVLTLSDRDNSTSTGDGRPVQALLDASPKNVALFLYTLGSTGRTQFARLSLDNLPVAKQREVGSYLLNDTFAGYDVFESTGLDRSITRTDMLQWEIKNDRNPFYRLRAQGLPRDQQSAYFDAVLNFTPEDADPNDKDLQTALRARNVSLANDGLRAGALTNLGAEDLEKLLAAGALAQTKQPNLKAFHDLPPGMMAQLMADGVDYHSLAEAAGNFTTADQRLLFEQLITSHNSRLVFKYPDEFSFITRSDLIDLARRTGALEYVALSIDEYTDGSNQELIAELVQHGTENSIRIADRLSRLPSLDIKWFVGMLEEKHEWGAVARCVGRGVEIDELALIDSILTLGPNQIARALPYNLENFNQSLFPQIVDKLLEAREYEVVAYRVRVFDDNLRAKVVRVLYQSPEGLSAIAGHLYSFPEIDLVDFAHKLTDTGLTRELARNFEHLCEAGVEPEWLYQSIEHDVGALESLMFALQNGEKYGISTTRILNSMLDIPEGYQAVYIFLNQAEPAIKARYVKVCVAARDTFYVGCGDAIDPMLAIKECLAAGWEEPFFRASNNLLSRAAELPDAETFLRMGGAASVLARSDLFPGASRTVVDDAYSQLLARNDNKLLALTLSRTSYSAPDEAAHRLLQTSSAVLISRRRELFRQSVFTTGFLQTYLATVGSEFAELYDYSGQTMPQVERAFSAFGKDCPPALIYAVGEVLDRSQGHLPDYLTQLGITETGNEGIAQLRVLNSQLRHQLVYGPEGDLAQFTHTILNNPLAASIARHLVRFDTSQWGAHGDNAWVATITPHLLSRNLHAPMPAEFTPSREYTVDTLDAKAFDPASIPEHVSDRFKVLRENIRSAAAFVDAHPSSAELYVEGRRILNTELTQLADRRQKLVAENAQPKALGALDRQAIEIRSLLALSPRQFSGLLRTDFRRFSSIKALSGLARTAIFARAIRKSVNARQLAQSLQYAEPSYDSLAQMLDFVEHIVNREVYRDFFTGENAKQSRRAFSSLLNTEALSEQLSKAQAGGTSGQTTLQFVPSRGLALELSGHAADACWASKEDSIANQHPNISAVMFMRNPGKTSERLVGACILIDTHDADSGERVLVIRGVDPIENYINHVRVDQFVDALFTYVKSIADGRCVAIVLDGVAGAATTNRPALLHYLETAVKGRRTSSTALHLPEDTTFNGYILGSQHPVYPLAED